MIRCALCPGVHKCLGPSGPEHADILGIGEAPGKDEERKGYVFAGKTGQELNQQYLPLAGLQRGGILLANSISCLPTANKGKLDPKSKKDQALLACCANTNLYPLIERGHFKALLPMGRFACDAVLPDFDLELGHGIPIESPWGIMAYPQYHPALGIHEPKRMSYIRRDWYRLKLWLYGKLPAVVDDYPNPDYREVEHVDQIDAVDPTQDLGADTESDKNGGPFCLTYSQQPGTGWLIRASRRDLLEAFQRKLDHWRARLVFHFWMADAPVLRKMALSFPHSRIVDTGSRIFHLGAFPQGLKAFAYRELGMAMQDFVDVVSPYSTMLVLKYYGLASTYEWEKPEPRLELDSKTGLWKRKQPQSMNTRLKRFFTDYRKNPDKDVFGMWEENWVEDQPMIEEKLGPWPGMCLSHVPFEKTLHYACRDADATLRAWRLIRRIERQVRVTSPERWRDAA
jgi:uracil-DNA glycosylase